MNNFFLSLPLLLLTGLFSPSAVAQSTYTIGGTEYYIGKYYSTTGQPVVKRSSSARQEFLHSRGFETVPTGFEVDHIRPLSQGGADESWNMQLLTIEEHARKTASERSSSTVVFPSWTPTTTFSSGTGGQLIQTGPRGGQYYINSSGNKTYIRK